VEDLIRQRGFCVQCVDATVVTEAPKLRPYIDRMRIRLARALNVRLEDVSVKAKTNEGIGDIGAGQAMAAHAVCLLTTESVEKKGKKK
jgi:2-C-methyl-D-erythritol 2,4-cyclodiphosphate synthase